MIMNNKYIVKVALWSHFICNTFLSLWDGASLSILLQCNINVIPLKTGLSFAQHFAAV